MRTLCGVVLGLLAAATARLEARDPIGDSVVKVYATRREPDFVRPWSKANPQEISGSGVIIEGKRVLTAGHMALYASQLFVQANQSTEKVPASVVAVAPGVDLAVIQVENPAFFDGRPALPLAEDIPGLKQTVNVYGFPIGGEQLSVTQGIVSRIEYAGLNYMTSGLRIQVDAALNPGNSGGPAVANGKIVGLVFSKMSRAENIGYLVAAEEIAMFLKDIEDGVYHGKPALWDDMQTTENDALRARLGLGSRGGMMITRPFSQDPHYPLKEWDVITRIGEAEIDSKGQVRLKDDLRLSFQYLIPKLVKDGRVQATIFRDQKTLEMEIPVRVDPNWVLPPLAGNYPRYFIFGPMVFSTASMDLVARAGGAVFVKQNPLANRMMDQRRFDGEELVTLGFGMLPHRITRGYDSQAFAVVTHVNGVPLRNLTHLVELLREAQGEYITFHFAGKYETLVFRREELAKATEDVLSDEGIRKQYSDDLDAVWRKK
ncbi:MAG: PDZ domain-containing protein [Thermoguttaceae bacterium]